MMERLLAEINVNQQMAEAMTKTGQEQMTAKMKTNRE
jgi:hypothetical protein